MGVFDRISFADGRNPLRGRPYSISIGRSPIRILLRRMGARGAVRNPPLRGASLQHKSGCGSVWLERYLREVEAASSNLVTPMNTLDRKPAYLLGLRFFFGVKNLYFLVKIWLRLVKRIFSCSKPRELLLCLCPYSSSFWQFPVNFRIILLQGSDCRRKR